MFAQRLRAQLICRLSGRAESTQTVQATLNRITGGEPFQQKDLAGLRGRVRVSLSVQQMILPPITDCRRHRRYSRYRLRGREDARLRRCARNHGVAQVGERTKGNAFYL